MKGLFLGAGASFEAGMPPVWDLTAEIRNWLTEAKLRSLNAAWQAQGGGYPDEVIDDFVPALLDPHLANQVTTVDSTASTYLEQFSPKPLSPGEVLLRELRAKGRAEKRATDGFA